MTRRVSVMPVVVVAIGLGLGSVMLSAAAAAQTSVPRLRYEAPADLLHSALRPPENYESTRIKASLQVYAFRRAPADIVDRFRQTLLRDWIDPQYQEVQLAGAPTFGSLATPPGADAAHYAQFPEVVSVGGMVKPRLRILIIAGQSAALIDAQAASIQAWQVALPSFDALIGTLRVEAGPSVSGPVTTATRALAGLYAGTKPKFVSAIGANVAPGAGGFVTALHLYLFSADGRVYRAYDEIRIPDADIRRFDFDAAQQADPVNSGRYVIEGDRVILIMGERREERIIVPLRQDGHLMIGAVDYTRR
jgi:hypothetical protein